MEGQGHGPVFHGLGHGALTGGRGQGETVPIPPVPRRRLSKIRHGDESSAQTDGGSDGGQGELPLTIHVTSVGVESRLTQEQQQRDGNSGEGSPSRKSWTKIFFYSSAAFLVCFIVVGMTLDYLDLWDPCVIHIPYEKHCTTDSYAGGLFYRTDYREESLCLVPGVFYSTKTTGWNTDGICSDGSEKTIPITSSPSQVPEIVTTGDIIAES